MTIHEARQKLISDLKNIYDEREAANIAELVMEHITRWSRVEQISNKTLPLSFAQNELLIQSISRLQNHEPIQYIVNEAWFCGMRFYVDKNVLIPRPETEELVEWIVKESGIKNPESRILDIGTGSGCIAIAIKNKLPAAEVWACDVSEEALNIARMNADALDTAIDFIPLNFLDPEQQKQLPNIDIIVSNPPYIPLQGINEMRKNVTEFEPHLALFVHDDDPFVFYKAIADFGKEKLHEHGNIYVEIHEDQGEEVKNIFLSKNYSSAEIKKDMQGKERMIRIRK